ncbi:uncharacterized protein LOC141884509 isoform X2 [Acropora palmata]|uniref:uncharacterized protein LOC141884509 isoform X2 n=1 Tax=Acropora palmata TaxID=6131 RepID=UPI003D9FFEF9
MTSFSRNVAAWFIFTLLVLNFLSYVLSEEEPRSNVKAKFPRQGNKWRLPCFSGRCHTPKGRRRQGKRLHGKVRAQFASDAEDFHNNYAVNLDSSSHKKNRNSENGRRLENS